MVAPSNWRQKKARQRCAHAFLFTLFLCAMYIYIKFSIIVSFRKFIPPFTLTEALFIHDLLRGRQLCGGCVSQTAKT